MAATVIEKLTSVNAACKGVRSASQNVPLSSPLRTVGLARWWVASSAAAAIAGSLPVVVPVGRRS